MYSDSIKDPYAWCICTTDNFNSKLLVPELFHLCIDKFVKRKLMLVTLCIVFQFCQYYVTNECSGFRDFFISLYFFDCRSVIDYLFSFIDCVALDATLLHVKRSSL